VFFSNWHQVARIALSAAIVYILVVLALRVIGARALAKMSAYDLVVTIALGSLVASIPLTTGITVSDGFTAIIVFLVLQEIVRRLQARYRVAHHAVRERPHLVVWDGQLVRDRLDNLAVSDDEVRGAIRQAGLASIGDAQAVVLENDGVWSVIRRQEGESDFSALEGLELPGDRAIEHGRVVQDA